MIDAAFEIRADWPQPPKEGGRDAALITLIVDGKSLTQLADVEANANRSYLRASAVSLALWLADNWWRVRWESLRNNQRPSADWRLRHELASISGGTIWPPIMIYGTGERVVIAPAFGANVSNGPIRYLDLTSVYTVSGNIYEAGVDAFFDRVLEACVRAQDVEALVTQIRELRAERKDPDLTSWRSLEARLGYDPDDAPEGLIESLSAMEDTLGKGAIEEASVANPGPEAEKILQMAVDASEASEIDADLSIVESISHEVIFERAARPWEWGEAAASAIRAAIGHSRGPVLDRTIGDMLAVPWLILKAASPTARRLPYAARLRHKGAIAKLALQTNAAVDRRFELARIVADAIWTREDFGVISRAKTERQKFQRAFAQNLLCPFSELRQYIDLADPTDEQMASAASHFRVHPSVVQTLLVIKGVLPRETLTQRLEAI